MKRLLLYALAGLLIGAPLDALHVATGVLEYAHPFFWKQAWWVPLLYSVAGIAVCEGVHQLKAFYKVASPRVSPFITVWSLIGFVFVYASSGFLKSMPLISIPLYLLIFALSSRYLWFGPKKLLIASGMSVAIVGAVVETLISLTGQFQHLHPDLGEIPVWLPFIYINVIFIAANFDDLLVRTSSNRVSNPVYK